MSITLAQRALEKALEGVSGIPVLAWENTGYEPVIGTPWARPLFKPFYHRSAGIGVGAPQKIEGLYLIDLFYPTGNGPAAAGAMAQTLINTFSPGTTLTESGTNVHVEYTERKAGEPDGQWFMIPVTMKWYAYV